MNLKNNIEKIVMSIPNYCVIITNNECSINDKKVDFNKNNFEHFLRIIRNWEFNYKGLDSSIKYYYKIRICTNLEEYIFRFINKVPDNFNDLIKFVGDLYAK